MKIIKPKHEHLSKAGLTPYQFIEKIGRLCYKSEDKVTPESAVPFVKGLCKRKHYAMTEHHWVHILYTGSSEDLINALNIYAIHDCRTKGNSYDLTKYMEITFFGNTYISAPLRVFMEMTDSISNLNANAIPALVDEMLSCVANAYSEIFPLQLSYRLTRHFEVVEEEEFCGELINEMYDCSHSDIDKELMKHKTHTVLFTCDRGVSHELVRHRPCSFAQESTRYCNYSKGKFEEEITVILPFFFDTGMGEQSNSLVFEAWKYSCEVAERKYMELLSYGATPQEARTVLPNSLKTEIVMTCNEKEWQHIVDLRAKDVTGPAHPQMKEIMCPWHEELKELSEGRIK